MILVLDAETNRRLATGAERQLRRKHVQRVRAGQSLRTIPPRLRGHRRRQCQRQGRQRYSCGPRHTRPSRRATHTPTAIPSTSPSTIPSAMIAPLVPDGRV